MSMPSPRPSAALQWLLGFACAASAGYWGLQWLPSTRPLPADVQAGAAPDTRQLAGNASALFASGSAAADRFRLWGVIGGGQGGAALIGVDGGAPKAYAVGTALAPGLVLAATGFASAALDNGGRRIELRLNPGAGTDPALPGAYAARGSVPGTPGPGQATAPHP